MAGLDRDGANLMANREILPKYDWAGRNNLSRPLFDLHQALRRIFASLCIRRRMP